MAEEKAEIQLWAQEERKRINKFENRMKEIYGEFSSKEPKV